jgi:hypothetical protein
MFPLTVFNSQTQSKPKQSAEFESMFFRNFKVKYLLNIFVLLLIVSVISSCAVKAKENSSADTAKTANLTTSNPSQNYSPKTTIEIEPNSPADTVRVFYMRLREKQFRDALFLTNLRPAIEGLTDDELKDLQVDFDRLAGQIPADVAINGEIIVKDVATVTAKLPDSETDELKVQEIKLRKENGIWVILTLDQQAENAVRKEGKNYFFALKIETHQDEAKAMIERIFKAQLAYSTQNGGTYSTFDTLVQSQFLPEDIRSTESTGYNYDIALSADKKSYRATAEPAIYAKTGKLSYALTVDTNRKSSIKSEDNKGKPVKL